MRRTSWSGCWMAPQCAWIAWSSERVYHVTRLSSHSRYYSEHAPSRVVSASAVHVGVLGHSEEGLQARRTEVRRADHPSGLPTPPPVPRPTALWRRRSLPRSSSRDAKTWLARSPARHSSDAAVPCRSNLVVMRPRPVVHHFENQYRYFSASTSCLSRSCSSHRGGIGRRVRTTK